MLQNPKKKIRKKMRQKLKVGNNFSMSKGDSWKIHRYIIMEAPGDLDTDIFRRQKSHPRKPERLHQPKSLHSVITFLGKNVHTAFASSKAWNFLFICELYSLANTAKLSPAFRWRLGSISVEKGSTSSLEAEVWCCVNQCSRGLLFFWFLQIISLNDRKDSLLRMAQFSSENLE